MKTLKLFLLPVLDSLEFGWRVIRYALIFVSAFFRQRASLGCEMVAIRSQLTFYEESIRQKRQPRPRFHPAFRLLWVLLSSVWTGWKSAAELMKPKTVLKWHEHAFLNWWRWKSRRKGGRPTISQEMRALIRRLSRENVLWSAETIHGHLVLLGFDPPCPDTIRKYMAKPKGGTDKSQTWLTFLRNHLPVSWAMDFFTVPTLRFQILYIFVILNHSRRQVVHFAVTPHPTTAWVIQQLREAMPFGQQPTYLFRDNDGIYGDEVGRFLAGTGIAEVKTAHRCPWQNPFVERYGGTLRRELLDHVIVLNEEHLKRLLKDFIEEYYHLARPHQGLNGDTPVLRAKPEPAANVSRLVSIPVVGGLHHRYIRVAA
jgi:transposase InsO family protein